MGTLYVLAAAASDRGSGEGIGFMLIYLVPLFAVLYFIMIRPQRKREQERKDMIARVQKGDRVVTVGGILGEIVRLNEREVVVRVDRSKDVELKMLRSAIQGVMGEKGEGDGEKGGT